VSEPITHMTFAWTGDGRLTIYVHRSALSPSGGPAMSAEEYRAFLPDLERPRPEESSDERLQRVERVMLAATEEWLQLSGQKEPPLPVDVDLSTGDMQALRETRAALARLTDTPTRWLNALDRILNAKPPAVTPETLTPEEWRALKEVRQMAAPNSFNSLLSERGDALLVSAIDKLREQAHAPVEPRTQRSGV